MAVFAILSICVSCSEDTKKVQEIVPSTEFAAYVKAYTGNNITAGSPIVIQFTSAPARMTTAGVLSISPQVEGDAKWTDEHTLTFYPSEGSVKSGEIYTVSCDMQKLFDISDERLNTFRFTFRTAEKHAKIEVGNVRISDEDPGHASLNGTIIFSEPMEYSQACGMLSVNYPHPGFVIDINDLGKKSTEFGFNIKNIPIPDMSQQLEVVLNAFGKTTSEIRTIPSGKDFDIISGRLVPGAEEYIELCFSKPVSATSDLSGLFTIQGGGRLISEVEDNIAKVYFERSKDNTVTLTTSRYLKSTSGDRLGKDITSVFVSEDLHPAVKMDLSGNIIPDISAFILPFKAVNLSAVDISIIKIFENNVLMFLQDNDLNQGSSLRRAGRLIYKNTMRLDTDNRDLHKWQDFSIDLGGLLKHEPGAIYRVRLSFRQEYSLYGKKMSEYTPSSLVEVSQGIISDEDNLIWDEPETYYYDSYFDWSSYTWNDRDDPTTPSYYMDSGRFPEHNLLSSNLGVIIKSADTGKIWVNVNDLMTTEPVSGAEVTAYNFQLQAIGKGVTDGEGSAVFDINGKPFVIIASKNDVKSYIKVADGYENPMSKFDVGGKTLENGIKGYVYGERGVWRPGDTIHLTAIIEDPDKSIPANHPAVVEVYSPQGQFHTKLVCPQSVNGFYTFDIKTEEDDPTGKWNAYVKLGGATFHKTLPVETIKPNRLKISLDIPDNMLESRKTTQMNLSASWLTGSVADGLNATGELSLKTTNHRFEGFKDYVFKNEVAPFSSDTYEIFNTTLDENGSAQLSVKMPAAQNAPGMLTASIITKVQEPGGDISTISQSVPFSPFNAYVGIKVPQTDSYYETDKDHVFKVAVVDKNGKRVSGHNIEYLIAKIDWNWWWEYGKNSYDSYVNSSSAKVMTRDTFVSGQTDKSITFSVKYPGWGRYHLLVKDLDSGHISCVEFMIDWPSWRGRADRENPDGVTMLAFTTDKKEYQVGDKCTVYIPAASESRTLVSIENGRKVISREWVKTSASGETPYSFTITEEMAPNFYVHLTLVQPHKNTVNDLPIRMYGVQPVMVNNPGSMLHPTISMPDVIRPQEEFNVTVGEKDGREMTYTLAIVDEGLLDITGFKTPNPWNHMYARTALGVRTWDIYDNVAGAFSGKFAPTLSIGGDEDIATNGKKQDNRFKPVVEFLGPFTIKGKKTHKITLPMYVGSVKVMVVAGKDRAYGNAEKVVPVRSPLMILPTLPRVLGTNETISLPVNVFAMENSVREVNVAVSVEGPVKIASSDRNTLKFKETGDKITRFELKTEGEGTAKIRIKATGNGYTAEETITIAVNNPAHPRLDSRIEVLGKGESREFKWDQDCEWVKFEAAGFPSIDYNELFTFTTGYSHYCTEQISSRGISLLYSMDKFNESNKALCSEMIEDLLSQLYSRQMADGSFRYWPGSGQHDPWCSIMAGHFMTAALQKGYKVDIGVYNNWKNHLKKTVKGYRSSVKDPQGDLNQGYGLYTLALAGCPENGAMNRMKESNPSLPQARWMLASAYSLCGKKQIAREILLKTKAYQYAENGLYLTYGVRGRDLAMAVEAHVLADELAEAMKWAEDVALETNRSRLTTQSAAFSSVALESLSKKITTKAIDLEVTQEKTTSVKSAKATTTFEVDRSSGSATVRNISDEPVYIKMASYGRMNSKAENAGLSMKIAYKDGNGNIINPEQIRQGTDFEAEVTVQNTSAIADYTDLALTLRIPAGWEIFNDRLYDLEDSGSDAYTHKDIRDDRCNWYFDLSKSASKTFRLRLSAAYEGTFSLPAASCESMYVTNVYAYTTAKTVTVTR